MNDLYLSKITQNSDYYGYERHDVINYINRYFKENNVSKKINTVLEVGCGDGGTGKLIKEKFKVNKYVGVELMDTIALKAEKNIDKAICGDFEKMLSSQNLNGIDKERYDMVLFLDTLEHMYNPWTVIKSVRDWLSEDGFLVLSIPNAGHISVIKKLVTDKFQYEKSGLLDITHIRFFTFFTIEKMLNDNGYEIAGFTTLNDLSIKKIKLFNFLTFNIFKKQFIISYTLIAKKIKT